MIVLGLNIGSSMCICPIALNISALVLNSALRLERVLPVHFSFTRSDYSDKVLILSGFVYDTWQSRSGSRVLHEKNKKVDFQTPDFRNRSVFSFL